MSGTVVAVRDGDTVQVSTFDGSKVEVRLLAIDAPEKGQSRQASQPFAEQSQDMLARLALNKRVTVDATAIDRYGRSVATMQVDDGRGSAIDAGLFQIQMGMARAHPHYLGELPDSMRESYKYAEAIARLKRRGLWAQTSPAAPSARRPQPATKPVAKKQARAVSKPQKQRR